MREKKSTYINMKKRKTLKEWQKVGSKVKITEYNKPPQGRHPSASRPGESRSPRKIVHTFTGTVKKRVKSDRSYVHAGQSVTYYKYTVDINSRLNKKTKAQLVKKMAASKKQSGLQLPRELIEKIIPKSSKKTITINESNRGIYSIAPLRSSSGSF